MEWSEECDERRIAAEPREQGDGYLFHRKQIPKDVLYDFL